MRKINSTNTINKNELEENCGMAYTISLIGGRWKLSILGFLLTKNKLRFNELKSELPGISERMLTKQLKELEADHLIIRTVYPQIPPKVEYGLSQKGKSLKNILLDLSSWGILNRSLG